jgi:hypothetical protein
MMTTKLPLSALVLRSAEQGCGGCRVEAVWDGGDVVCGAEDVLLEGARGVVARDFLFS